MAHQKLDAFLVQNEKELLVTDYESLLEDLLRAGIKATVSSAADLANRAFWGEELPARQAAVVEAWETRTLAEPWKPNRSTPTRE